MEAHIGAARRYRPAMDSHLARDRRTLAALSELDARSRAEPRQANIRMSLHECTFTSKGKT
jgi:hypothetical protein